MCGINGIFAYHYAANAVDERELLRTRDAMAARGPDGAGAWRSADGRIALGHRRLSIIDLSNGGAQPMLSSDGNVIVTFNGEIYNHRELRRGLEAKGHVLRTQSDTEVLLHLYADKGSDLVGDLRGMFAFALWDAHNRQLLLARDPFGIKPIYYADDGWTFRFASQVKALQAGGAIPADPEPAGVVGFHLTGSVPEPFTTLAAVRALPAGSTLVVDRLGHRSPQRYFSVGAVYRAGEEAGRTAARAAAQTQEQARSALLDSVRSHLIADVPVGSFLSAGVDSGALVGLMRDAGASAITTVTVAFDELAGTTDDEAPLAAETAALYGTEHTTRRVGRAEFEADLPRIMAAMDQPSIDGINTWFVAKAARERGLKVAVSGLGGDELLGGYPSFASVPRWVTAMALPALLPGFGVAARKLSAPLARLFAFNPKVAGMCELGGTYAGAYLLKRGLLLPWELGSVLDPDTTRIGLERLDLIGMLNQELDLPLRTPFARVATLESSFYLRNQLLRDTDWASMAHSLEVRVPLVDSVLLSQMASITPYLARGEGKALLANAPRTPLPGAITSRRKTGFTTPIAAWTREAASSGTAESTPWARGWARTVGRQFALT